MQKFAVIILPIVSLGAGKHFGVQRFVERCRGVKVGKVPVDIQFVVFIKKFVFVCEFRLGRAGIA